MEELRTIVRSGRTGVVETVSEWPDRSTPKMESIFDEDLTVPFTQEDFLKLDGFNQICAVCECVCNWRFGGWYLFSLDERDGYKDKNEPTYIETILGNKIPIYATVPMSGNLRRQGFKPLSQVRHAMQLAENWMRRNPEYTVQLQYSAEEDVWNVWTEASHRYRTYGYGGHQKLPMAICLSLLRASGKMV